MNLKKIENKYVIHCDTEEKAIFLIRMALESGYHWVSEGNDETRWDVHRENTCYHFRDDQSISFDSMEHYEENGFEVLELFLEP
jgi:hypothetical protein